MNDDILKAVKILLKGSVLARLISMLSIPVITRLYTPEEFGLATYLTSIAIFVSTISSFRYHLAIPLPKRKPTSEILYKISVFSAFTISLVLFSINIIYNLCFHNKLYSIELFIYPYAFVLLVYDAMMMKSIRASNYSLVSTSKVVISTIIAGAKISTSFIAPNAISLILSQCIAHLYAIRVLNRNKRKNNAKTKLTLKRVRIVCKYYQEFPFYRLPSQLILSFCLYSPVVFINYLYDHSSVGQYALAYSILSIPLSMISQSIGQAFFSEISRRYREQPFKLFESCVFLIKKLFFIAIIPTLLLTLLGEELFTLLFGSSWRMAGVIVSILAWYMLPNILITPIMSILSLIKRSDIYFFINFFRFIGLITTYLVSYFLFKDEILNFVMSISILNFFFYLFALLFTLKVIFNEDKKVC